MDRGEWMFAQVLLLVAVLAFAGTASAATLLFQDGFENVAVSDYPDENGWRTLLTGKNAYVSNEVARNGYRSFRLDSWPWWARMEYVRLDETPDRLSCEASVYVDPHYGWVGLVGFMDSCANETPMWNYFRVDGGAGRVKFHGATVVDLAPYTPGTWCTVRADLDYETLKADLWVNGQPVPEPVDITPREFNYPPVGDVVLDKWGVNSANYTDYIRLSNVVFFDDLTVSSTPTTLTVDLDIKPGSDRNPVNPRSRGLLPVTVFSSDSFDVTDIDPDTVRLAGASIAVRGKHGKYMAHPEDIDGDGLLDLVVHFDTQDLCLDDLRCGCALLSGSTRDGRQFEGCDQITLVPSR